MEEQTDTEYERLSYTSEEYVLDTRSGIQVDPEMFEPVESWTIVTKRHAPPMFKIYEAIDDTEYDYIVMLRDGGITTQTEFFGFDEPSLDNVIDAFEDNPLIVRHRTPGELLGEPAEGIEVNRV